MLPLRKGFCFLVGVVALTGTALVITSTATTHWVWSYVYRNTSTDPDDYGNNPYLEYPQDRGTLLGTLYVGLFNGVSYLNWGGGGRRVYLSTFEFMQGVFNEGVWISVIAFCCLSMIFGAITVVFACYNTIVVPVNMVTGVFGLYIWTGIAAVCTGTAMVLFIIEYYINLVDGIVNDYLYEESWRTQWVHFDYSFWLVVAAFCLFTGNVIFVKLASLGQDEDISFPVTAGQETGKGCDVGMVLMY